MNLVDEVTTRLNIDETKAVRGLGGLFIAVRMTVDAKTFSLVAGAFPDVGIWMQQAPFQHGGTGEMLAMATPGAVVRVMGFAGFDETQVHAVGGLVGAAIKDVIPAPAYADLVETLPMLRAADD